VGKRKCGNAESAGKRKSGKAECDRIVGRWMNGRVTEGRMEGRKDGTYCAGVKDLASAYVLCPRLTELCVFLFGGVGITERDLGKGYGGRGRKECGKMEGVRKDGIGSNTSWFSSWRLTTTACRNIYGMEQ
jgi:hypothetical protein